MHHIIEQIDACLAVLHQAREILLNHGKRMPATKITGYKRGFGTNYKKLQKSSGQPAEKIRDASQKSAGGRSSSKRYVVSTRPSKTPSPVVSHSEPTVTMNSNEEILVREIVKRVPAKRRTTFKRFASGRTPESTKLEPKPTTALSHPIRSNVVVISAEQLRLERERQVKPVVARPRSPGSGATGRSAFEALFGQ